MSHGYATSSALSGLAAAAFTWSSAYALNRTRLNDGILDEVVPGSAAAQASGQTLVWDLGSAQALVGVALLNHNLATGACTVKVEGADDAAITVNAVVAKAASTIVTTAPNQKDTVLQFPSVTKRYWRLTFVHTGTKTLTFGEIQALTTITALSRTTVYGAGDKLRFITNQVDSKTMHQRSTFIGGPHRTRLLPFGELVGTAERDELMAMWFAVQGSVSNLLWVEFIESTATAATAAGQECIWGKLEETFGWAQPDFNLFTVDGFKLVSQGREVGS